MFALQEKDPYVDIHVRLETTTGMAYNVLITFSHLTLVPSNFNAADLHTMQAKFFSATSSVPMIRGPYPKKGIDTFNGAIEGAVLSGERAASETIKAEN